MASLADADQEIVESITEARRKVLRNPSSSETWGNLGMIYRAHDFAREANASLSQAEHLDPGDWRWPYLQGLTLLQSDPIEGIACLRRALDHRPNSSAELRLRLGEALLGDGQVDEGKQEIAAVLAAEPHNAHAQLDQGRLEILQQNWRGAQEYLSACAQDTHSRKQAATLLAFVYRRLGDVRNAAGEEERAAKLPEDEHWPDALIDKVMNLQRGLKARLTVARSLIASGQPREAVSLLEDTGNLYPSSPVPRLLLAEIWRTLGAPGRAEAACRQAIAADPKEAQGWFLLGCFQAADRPKEAVESFQRAIQLKPDHALAHFNLGHRLKMLGDSRGAAREFQATLRCQPDYEPARAALKELGSAPRT